MTYFMVHEQNMTQLYRFRVGDPYFVLQTRSFKLLVFAASKSVDRNMLGKACAPETYKRSTN